MVPVGISWYFRRLGRMDAGEIRSRLWRTGRDRLRFIGWKIGRSRRWTSPARIRRTHRGNPVEFAARWDQGGLLLRSDLPPVGHPDYTTWPGLDVDRVLQAADLALAEKISAFGLDPVDISSGDDWHTDPMGEGVWPNGFAPLLNHRNTATGGARILWEMHRLTHLTILGHAYRITGDIRYAYGVRRGLLSWMNANPPETGMGWQSPMELAIRALSILHAADLVAGSGALSGRIAEWIGPCLAHHGAAIHRSISVGSSANNHTIGEAAGLVVLGSRLPELVGADRWLRTGKKVLTRAIEKQFAPDGSGREQAPHYQAFAMDFIVQAVIALRRSKRSAPEAWLRSLDRGARFLASLVVHGGRAFEPGDSDDGRVHGFGPGPHHAVRDTVRTVAMLIGQPNIARSPVGPITSSTGRWFVEDLDRREPSSSFTRPVNSIFHPDAGWAVLRHGNGLAERALFFDAGPHGFSPLDAHAHADALAVSLYVGGEPIIVDPGTYRYHGDPQWRDHFRSTRAHATVEIDGRDQSRMAGPFLWSSRAKTQVRSVRFGAELELVDASHDGYADLPDPVTHRRRILNLGEGRFLIHDRIECAQSHGVVMRLPLAPGMRIDPPDSSQGGDEGISILSESPKGTMLGIVIGASIPLQVNLREGGDTAWHSDGFCQRSPAPVVEASGTCHGPCDIWTYLSTAAPGEETGSIPEAAIRLDVEDRRGFSVPNAFGLSLLDRSGFSVVMLAPSDEVGPLHCAGWSFQGLAAMRTELPGSRSPHHRLISASPIELKNSDNGPMKTKGSSHLAG